MAGPRPNPSTQFRPWISALIMAAGVVGAPLASAAESAVPLTPVSDPRLPFAIGDRLEARVGDVWIPAQVRSFQQIRTPRGSEVGYAVSLANGKKAILSAKQLRKPASR
ncbi:MAG: hypothetical protein JNM61_11985 [Zoogloeaceae bacterium]|nr:hypothetical protein [Zoogloeaceae bacterium]